MKSVFKRVAVGFVLTPNEDVKRVLELVVTESMHKDLSTFENGKETTLDKDNGIAGSLTDVSGNVLVTKAKRGSTIKATWFGGDNRVTPPNVTLGETVEIYQMGNTDMYFWKTLFYEVDKRGKEKVLYMYSNIDRKKEPKVLVNKDNSHWFIVDALNQSVQLHTSDNNDEKYTWDLAIDMKEGTFDIKSGNGEYIHIEKDNIEIFANKSITLKSEVINLEADTIKEKASAHSIEGGKLTIKSKTDTKGAVNFLGSTNFKAAATMNANASVVKHSKVL